MKRNKYTDIVVGEWYEIANMQHYPVKCCDCGLVHVFQFRIMNGRIQYKVKEAYRRKPKQTCV